MPEVLLRVSALTKDFAIGGGFAGLGARKFRAVDEVGFELAAGRTLGIVGESGSGKSTLARCLVRLVEPTSGAVEFDGEDVLQLRGDQLKRFRRSVQMIFQDPYGSLNPRLTIGDAVEEPLRVHRIGTPAERQDRVVSLLETVGLSADHRSRYPHEFSGGQRQRIAVARSLSLEPKAIILDEPVSALDVSIQAQIMNLLIDLQRTLYLTYLIISHDLAVVEHASSHIGVMYLGHLVELSAAGELYKNPLHPYTRALLESVPVPDPENIKPVTLEGEVPNPMFPPEGCPFHPRCKDRKEICRTRMPKRIEHSAGHYVTCQLYG